MATIYRVIKQWNQWLTHFLGQDLLEAEQKTISLMQSGKYGNSMVLIGVPQQANFLNTSLISNKYLLSPLHADTKYSFIEADFYELPILSGSVDQVILPHSLELIDNPQQLLSEACRIVRPEGHIYITGFNPYSLWGIKRYFTPDLTIPWSRSFISADKIKTWLSLADFELVRQTTALFRPPIQYLSIYKKLKFLEWFGKKCYKPFGGIYILEAKAKVIPLTPIRLLWKQELTGMRIFPRSLSGIIRNST